MKSSELNFLSGMPIAEKELFRIWYEFYRLALGSSDKKIRSALKKSAKFYEPWGNDLTVHFDDWWKTHRFLFIDLERVQIAKSEGKISGVTIWVPQGKSEFVLLKEFRELLRSEPELFKLAKRKIVSKHRYAPTEVQGVKRESLRMMLALQQQVFSREQLKGDDLLRRVLKYFSSERYKRKINKVPASFLIVPTTTRQDHYDEAMRNVRRYRQKAAKLLLNVASGTFPGRY